MAVSILTRCSHFRRFISVSNNAAVLLSNATRHSITKSRSYVTEKTNTDIINDIFESDCEEKSNKKISKAAMAYLQRAKEYDEFMKKEITEYEIGKRHLANMMGEDPECFTQADIDRSIEYLFPSGLYDPKARPTMRHPEEIFPSKKEAEFDESGRPFHFLFYTANPNYNEILHDIVRKLKSLNDIEDSLIKQGILSGPTDQIDLIGSTWLSKMEIEKQILETIHDVEYNYLITSLERLCDHPLSNRELQFITKYRKTLTTHSNEIIIPPLEHDNTGRPYITVKNCMRKSARGEVTLWGNGTGAVSINGQDITYFQNIRHREQVSYCEF